MKKSIVALVLFVALPAFGLIGGASSKLVGTNSGTVCTSGSDAISVLPGTTVYYCYSFTNLSTIPTYVHVTDDHIGMIMNNTPVVPGNTTFAVRSYPIYLNETTNIATFSAEFKNLSYDPYYANESATVGIQFPLQVFKSVSTEPPPACGSTGKVFADIGTPLYYCYQTVNLSNMTVSYDINDDQLGTVASNLNIGPHSNETVWANTTFPNVLSLTNVATWTVNGLPNMSATAPATVLAEHHVPAASETTMILLGLALIVAAIVMIRLR